MSCNTCGKNLYKNPSGQSTLCYDCYKQFCPSHKFNHTCISNTRVEKSPCHTCDKPSKGAPCNLCNTFYCDEHIINHGHIIQEPEPKSVPMCDFFHCTKPAFSQTGRCLAHGNRVMFK